MSGRNVAYRLVRRTADLLPRLDAAQQAVVGHTSGPLLVLGGPGTGKTTTLVSAVAARVAEGTDPERLLVLTFGRRAAAALRHRMERRIIGGRAVREPLVRTFHSYAYGLLRRAAAARGEPPPRLLTGAEQDVVIRELLAGDRAADGTEAAGGEASGDEAPAGRYGWPERLRPALRTREFARQLRDLLLRAAERGIDTAALARLGAVHGRADWQAAARFREEYEAVLALREAGAGGGAAYDHAELVRAAVALLRDDPALLAAQRQRLAMVYVDEFADTDPAQRELLELVAGAGAPLVVFADPDSATFGFRGSDPDGVRTFPDRFATLTGAPAPTVTLTRCYRAGSGLLSAAARVGRRLRGPVGHRQLTPVESGGTLEVRTFPTAAREHAWLAYQLREAHLRQGVPWSRMAVLVRAGRQLPPIQRALRAAEVPAVVHSEDLPLAAQPAVAPLLRLVRCALEPDRLDEEAVVSLLHSPLGGADPLSERRLRQGLRARAVATGDPRPSGVLLVDAVRDPEVLAGVDRRWAGPAQAVAGLLRTAREAAAAPDATAEDVLWAVWQASGLAQRWSSTDEVRSESADRELDAVVALFDAAARFTDRLPGARVTAFLDHVQSQELPADSLAPVADRGEAVRLLTAHAAKGQEWDVVAIPGVQEGVWPDLRPRGSLLGVDQLVDAHAGRELDQVGRLAALLDEERRLFYVAVTRARRTLLVTAVAATSVGEHQPEEPSRFLRELAGGEPGGPDRGAGPGSAAGPGDPAGPGGPDRSGAAPSGDGPGGDGPGGGSGTDPEPAAGTGPEPPRPLTLPALVARLRAVVTDPAAAPELRRSAAGQLARLAAAGVRGAHPDQWWGLAPLSDDRPLADPGQLVRVSPSAMESALRCGLRWLLERHGGAARPSSAQQVGDLVHATATLADQAGADRTVLMKWLAERFDAIEHAAAWLAGPERERAEQMVDKLLRWVAENPRRLVAVEREFAVRVGTVELRGRVDRLELDEDGRLVVVDLKTGRSAPTNAEIAEHPQLGAYQAAVAAGAFAEHGTEPGGAALVHLGTSGKQARVQEQPPLVDTEDPAWASALVRRTGAVMAAATFTAVRNHRCRVCPVRPACPISGQGRQVVEP